MAYVDWEDIARMSSELRHDTKPSRANKKFKLK